MSPSHLCIFESTATLKAYYAAMRPTWWHLTAHRRLGPKAFDDDSGPKPLTATDDQQRRRRKSTASWSPLYVEHSRSELNIYRTMRHGGRCPSVFGYCSDVDLQLAGTETIEPSPFLIHSGTVSVDQNFGRALKDRVRIAHFDDIGSCIPLL